MELNKMRKITLTYDPVNGCSLSDGKIKTFVNQAIEVFKKEGIYKSNFGNIAVIQEFLTQLAKNDIKADLIEILYSVEGKLVRTVVSLD